MGMTLAVSVSEESGIRDMAEHTQGRGRGGVTHLTVQELDGMVVLKKPSS